MMERKPIEEMTIAERMGEFGEIMDAARKGENTLESVFYAVRAYADRQNEAMADEIKRLSGLALRHVGEAVALMDQLATLRPRQIEETIVWPMGCEDPDSCHRHQNCMYMKCIWQGKDMTRTMLTPKVQK